MKNSCDYMKIRELHKSMPPEKYIRNLKKRQVSRISLDGNSHIVKCYKLAWWQKLLKIYPGNTSALRELEGLTPHCEANFRDGGWQVTIYEDAGELNLLNTAPLQETYPHPEQLFKSAGELLGKIHNRNLYHADTKPPNFAVNTRISSMPPVVIVDCDRVIKYKKLPERRRCFNLAQFLAGSKVFPAPALLQECMAQFFLAYRETTGIDSGTFLKLLASVSHTAINNPRVEKRAPRDFLDLDWLANDRRFH